MEHEVNNESANQIHNLNEPIYFRLTSFGHSLLNAKLRQEVSLRCGKIYPQDQAKITALTAEALAQYISETGVAAMPISEFATTFKGHADGNIHPIIENDTFWFVNPDETVQP